MKKFIIKSDIENYTREIGGVHFVDGVGTTDNEDIAMWLEGRGGFTVEVAEKKKTISQMNSDELDAYAIELGIDIPVETKVPEKKDIIKAFLEFKKDKE